MSWENEDDSSTDSDDDEVANICLMANDEKGCKIHCVVRKDFIPHYEHLLKEGQIYSLRRFTAVPN
ncbi:hypothetical protein PIB30_099513, partial [Stylosanthes scabra]|nr:hypothetical protein [Stylosanthes scabra]